MDRESFCRCHWAYYLVLEKDFRQLERFVAFELGDNYLYTNFQPTNKETSECYSNEFVKQYQAICSEVDVILKTICTEILPNSTADKMGEYTTEVLAAWPHIITQKVLANKIELQPFMNWKATPQFQSPDWWTPYNKVKHERLSHYKKANLKNTLNALAGLFVLEQYLVKHIGDRDSEYDVPNDISRLFEMVNYQTRRHVIGYESYLTEAEDIDVMFNA